MIEAAGFRVIIKPDAVVKKTQSGILIASDERLERGATDRGIVVNIGPEAFLSYNRAAGFADYRPWCLVGDYVSYAKYAGKNVEDPDTKEHLVVLNDEDIVAILKRKHDLDAQSTTDSPAS